MSFVPLHWWWYGGSGSGGSGGGPNPPDPTMPASTLILPDPPERYSRDTFLQMQATLEQQDALLHKRTGDIYHPSSVTVRHRTIYPWVTFTANDTTPSIARGRNFKTANTVPTTISSFDDGIDGQEIIVRVDDSSTVFDFTASLLVGNGGTDYIASNGDQLRATYDASEGVWFCQIIEV
jgi:hypothetical protein